MKKILIIVSVLSLFYIIKNQNVVVLPDDNIRYRIIANSNSEADQKVKWEINKELIPILMDINKNSVSKKEVQENIIKNQDRINEIISKYTSDYKLDYGYNLFPEKKYNGVKYKKGKYESLVIYLGQAKGDNWWCVMFPPLCLLEGQYENTNDIKYELFIKNRIKQYL